MLLKYYQKLDDAISYLFSSVSDEKKLLKNILGKKKLFYIDIGTNEGNFIEFLLKFFSFHKIICFEPIKELSLQLNNKFKNNNIEINTRALSNLEKKRRFYQYEISSQSSMYRQNNTFKSLKKLKNTFIIKTAIFDKIFKNKKIDFCKIDVQGEEINVLKGMKQNLKKKNIKLIKIEISFTERYLGVRSNFYEIITFLYKYNYHLISISKIKYKDNKILLMDAYFLSK
jgi:FkbM family methyltransferase